MTPGMATRLHYSEALLFVSPVPVPYSLDCLVHAVCVGAHHHGSHVVVRARLVRRNDSSHALKCSSPRLFVFPLTLRNPGSSGATLSYTDRGYQLDRFD